MTVRNDVHNVSLWADKIVCRYSKSFVGHGDSAVPNYYLCAERTPQSFTFSP